MADHAPFRLVLRESVEVRIFFLIIITIIKTRTDLVNSYQNLVRASDSTSYELVVPRYDVRTPQSMLWVERDLGQCVLALLKNYESRAKDVLGQTFYAVSERMTYTQLAEQLQTGEYVRFVCLFAFPCVYL